MNKPKLLIVDDEPDMAEFVGEVAEDLGFESIIAFNAADCLELAKTENPVAIVMDVVMPNMDGVELVKELGELVTGLPIIVMSGYEQLYTDMVNTLADNAGLIILGKLQKPFTAGQLEPLLLLVLETME